MRLAVTALLLATSAIPAVAQTQPAKIGPAAYGDWRVDAPGVIRFIRPGDMPAPYASPSAAERASITTRPADLLPKAPPGFTVSLFASGLAMPRAMRVAPNGDVFLSESGAGRIRIFRPQADGAPKSEVFATGLNRPFGIAFYPPGPEPKYVYVAETGAVVRYPYTSGDLTAGGPAETVIAELPTGGHWTRDVVFTPDGHYMMISVGSGSNIGVDMTGPPPGGYAAYDQAHGIGAGYASDTGRADVLRFSPDGRDETTYATGIRNCVSLSWQPETGSLWCAVNERDGLGDNLVPDYVTHVQPGHFYGWPWYYIGDHEEPRLKGQRPDLAGKITTPDVLIQPHSAPLGIAFYEGSQFPAAYKGDAFVALHGSWNRAQRTGYKVVRILMHDGVPTGEYQDFLTGFINPATGDIWGRPVGVTVTQDGSLLVSEDGSGTIWKVSASAK